MSEKTVITLASALEQAIAANVAGILGA